MLLGPILLDATGTQRCTGKWCLRKISLKSNECTQEKILFSKIGDLLKGDSIIGVFVININVKKI